MVPRAIAGVLIWIMGGQSQLELAASPTVVGVLLVGKHIVLERATLLKMVATPVSVPEMDPSVLALPVHQLLACLEIHKLPTMVCMKMTAADAHVGVESSAAVEYPAP